MFIAKVSFLMDLVREYKPELTEGLMRILPSGMSTKSSATGYLRMFGLILIMTIDHAVMEPAALEGPVGVVPAKFGTYSVHISGRSNLLERLG